MSMITFPVPEGLLDLLRDFTVAVVRNQPSNIEKFAAEYFSELAEAMDRTEAESVECSRTNSSVVFDESMFMTGYDVDAEGLDGSQKGSQRSMAESQRSHVSGSSAKSGDFMPPGEKCEDDAEKCMEEWKKLHGDFGVKTCKDEADAAAQHASSAGVWEDIEHESVKDGGSVRTTDSVAKEGSDVKLADEHDSNVRLDTVVRESSVRESSVKPADDQQSVKSGGSAK